MTRTAEVLHITPSAVSHAVGRLRDTLDDPLFQRNRNKMVPTPACQRMAPLIIDNLTRLQQILQQWGEFNPSESQHHFQIGTHDALEPSLLPPLADYLAKHAPNATFSSTKVDRSSLARELSAGHIDVALDIAMRIRQPVKHVEIIKDELVVLMRKDHPNAQNFSAQHYLNADHITVSNRPIGMTAEDTAFQQRGLNRNVKIRCQNYFAAREILKKSDLLLTLTSTLANQLIDEQLLWKDIPYRIAPFSVHLYWHENTEQDAALKWLRTVLQNEIHL